MPDLCRPRRGATHTLDTALRALAALGVDDARIAVESVGPGWPDGRVVRQAPAPGAPLDARTRVVLGVGGVGALDALPYALRDADDAPFGVDALVALFDTPALKLRYHLRAGGDFFALRDGDLTSARRWIEQVFQVDPAPWAPERWPALARLLPLLHRLAGRPAGLAAALRVLFDLPLAEARAVRGVAYARDGVRLALGTAGSRLGVDTLLGFGPVDVARVAVTLGPVSLATYLAHEDGPDGRLTAERRAMYGLLLPAPLADAVDERWLVGDPAVAGRLGDAFGDPLGYGPDAGPDSSSGGSLDGSSDGPAGGASARARRPEPAALGLTTRLGAAPNPAPHPAL